MKIYTRFLPFVCVLVALLTYSGCGPGPGPEPTVEEVQLGKLKATWKLTGSTTDVKLDGASKKTDYANFQLIIDGTVGATSFGYSTTGRPSLSPWPSSGTWAFGADPSTMIVRDPDKTADKLDMTYTVTDTELQLTFNFTGQGYSRTSIVTGQWVFTFAK